MKNYALLIFAFTTLSANSPKNITNIKSNQHRLSYDINTIYNVPELNIDTLEVFLNIIRFKESTNDYNAVGKKGEIGAYQFMPDTWERLCKKYYKKVLTPSKRNQDRVAKRYAKQLLSKYSIYQAASIWNCGRPIPKEDNLQTPIYVQHFTELYQDTVRTKWHGLKKERLIKNPFLNV